MPTQRPKYVVSACLAGVRCAYDGEHRQLDKVVELVRQGLAVPVCPEQLGGLPTPRPPVEISKGRVVDQKGNDLSLNFERGAKEAFKLCSMAGCSRAILKARSPSCGSGCVYDGTFQGQRTSGDGIFAALLKSSGIAVFTDEEADSLPPEESCA
jgi:uncharacterized protein YbbK (DUF523 family)